jgi:hypothetical protein
MSCPERECTVQSMEEDGTVAIIISLALGTEASIEYE